NRDRLLSAQTGREGRRPCGSRPGAGGLAGACGTYLPTLPAGGRTGSRGNRSGTGDRAAGRRTARRASLGATAGRGRFGVRPHVRSARAGRKKGYPSMRNQPVEILLVEDNEDDIVLTQEAFTEARLVNVINTVRDGEEALAYLRREGKYKVARLPGLILLDINMPKKNGFEVLEAMKADPSLRSLPVIMLTTSDREEDIVRSYADGACSYIRKPVDLDRFVDVVKQFELYWTLVSQIPSRGR